MSEGAFEDAKRYVSVWQDPEVNPLELMRELLDEHEGLVACACDELREELEGEHKDTLEDLHEALIEVLALIDRDAEYKYEHTKVDELPRHLEREVSTIRLRIAADAEREQADKFADLEHEHKRALSDLQHEHERALFRIRLLETELARLKEGASLKPKPKRKRRGVSP